MNSLVTIETPQYYIYSTVHDRTLISQYMEPQGSSISSPIPLMQLM